MQVRYLAIAVIKKVFKTLKNNKFDKKLIKKHLNDKYQKVFKNKLLIKF